MKVKPKEALLNLPVVLLFENDWEIPSFVSNVNAVLHGKIRCKSEDLGMLGGKHVGIFYLNRHDEFQELHDEFVNMINIEEESNHIQSLISSSLYNDNLDIICDHCNRSKDECQC